MGNIMKTAKCRFCGQMTQIESDEELTVAQAEEQATMTCNCPDAVEYQKEKQRKEKAMQNVATLFGEAATPDKRCGEGIVKILKAAVEEIYTGGLAKVTLNLRGGVKASISQNSKGEINVERTETKNRNSQSNDRRVNRWQQDSASKTHSIKTAKQGLTNLRERDSGQRTFRFSRCTATP